MKKLMLFAAFALAGIASSFAGDFSKLTFENELDAASMASFDGQMLTIIVPYNGTGDAVVTNSERYGSKTFTVPVTTYTASNNAANPPKDSSGKAYTPVPLPKGSYSLGEQKAMGNSTYGTGVKINATVTTPYQDGSGSFQANDFYVHSTPYNNTWGCVGVKEGAGSSASENMSKITNAINTSSGSKTIIVR